jgi:hypothetical protein
MKNMWQTATGSEAYLHDKLHNSVEITNQMQPCNRIYYSTVYWRLNTFRAAHRSSSSGALTVFAASGLHTHVVTGRSQVWVGTVNSKFCYKVASGWLFLLSHTRMHGSMNLKAA